MHTGDLGRMDEDGYFYFVDRKKQALRRRGENISSFEVEAVINAHPAVLESCVVGVPSGRRRGGGEGRGRAEGRSRRWPRRS